MICKKTKRLKSCVRVNMILLLMALSLSLAGCSQEMRIKRLIGDFGCSGTGQDIVTVREVIEMGSPAVEPLIVALQDDNWCIREKAAMALGEIGDTRAVEPLVAALEDDNCRVRESAAGALIKVGDTRAVEPLIVALRDSKCRDINARTNAAWALGKIGDTRAVEPLIVALRDELRGVRMGAAWALGEIGDTRAVEPLIAALSDNDADVCSYALESLVKLGSLDIDSLIDYLRDENTSVRMGTAQALARIGSPAIDPLITALQEERLDIVAEAYPFFILRGEPDTEAVLIRALDKYGNKEMALDYLNCGNDQLEKAAYDWAESHGYQIEATLGSYGGPTWGSNR